MQYLLRGVPVMARFLVFSTVFYVLGIILGRYCISLPVSFCLALAVLVSGR
ncbi:MAG: hypothetical protein ACOX1I_01255 [Dethiobacteria bacterium]